MLAIVIPYYKIDFFEQALASLAAQTNKRFNVYIGNDASIDNPEPIIQKYKQQLNITYRKFSTNIGGNSLVRQWTRCIELVQDEDWLMILGDDDYISDNTIEEFYNNLEKIEQGNYNVIKFSSKIIDQHSYVNGIYTLKESYLDPVDDYINKLKGDSRSSLSEHIFSKKMYDAFGFFEYPLGWHSDDMAWVSFSGKIPIYCINSTFVYIRISPKSITGNFADTNTKDYATVLFINDLLKLPDNKINRKQKLFLLRSIEHLPQNQTFKRKIKNINKYFKYGGAVAVLKYIKSII